MSGLFFQNCSATKFNATGLDSASKVASDSVHLQQLSCATRNNGQIWMEPTNQTRQQVVFCEYGGSRFENFRIEIEKMCHNAVTSNTGNSRELSEGFTGICNSKPIDKTGGCGTHANATTWQETDTEDSPRDCPSSSVQVTDVYNRVTSYRCDVDVIKTISKMRTTLLRTIGTCQALNCSSQFASGVVLKNAPASLSWTCINASTAKYDCSNGQQNAAVTLAGSAGILTTKSGAISCAVTGTNSIGTTHQSVATLTVRECNPGTTTTDGCLALSKGTASRTCASDGMSYGSCQYGCNTGYILSGAATNSPVCTAPPLCPAGRFQCGGGDFNSSGTVYTISCGERGFNFDRDVTNGIWGWLANDLVYLKSDRNVIIGNCCFTKDGSTAYGCTKHSVNIAR